MTRPDGKKQGKSWARPGTQQVYRQTPAEMEQLRKEQEAEKMALRQKRMDMFKACFKKRILAQIKRIQTEDRIAAENMKAVGESVETFQVDNEGYF